MALIKSISGIRGTIGGRPGESLTAIDIVKFAAAYGNIISERRNDKSLTTKIVIGRDGRISGEMVSELVTNTLLSIGIDVIDLGLSTTPTVELATKLENAEMWAEGLVRIPLYFGLSEAEQYKIVEQIKQIVKHW